jgi:hypothetical protein
MGTLPDGRHASGTGTSEEVTGVRLRDHVRWQEVTHQSLAVGDVIITPCSLVMTVDLRGGSLVWRRPIAILVERAGRAERLPIRDVTRRAQLCCLVLGLVAVLGAIATCKESPR